DPNFRRSRGVRRGDSARKRMIWRYGDHKRPRGLEIAGGVWREFIMGFPIHVIKVAVNPELIITDLGFKSRVTTPAFLFREGSLERVKVKARKQSERPPDTG